VTATDGAHYLTDVLASVFVAALAAGLIVRFGKPLLQRLVLIVERANRPDRDPASPPLPRQRE